jgi:hypothetical protein
MSSLPLFQLRPQFSLNQTKCRHVSFNAMKSVSKKEFIQFFPKFKHLLLDSDIYSIKPNSVEINGQANYNVKITTDGCFDIICSDCEIFYRIFTRGSIAMVQESKFHMFKDNKQNFVGRFIPSPLARFVTVNTSVAPCDSNGENDQTFNDEINNWDDDDFDFMFSNEIKPIIGAYKETAPLLLA